MKNQLKSNPDIIATYGSKPRGSVSSKKVIVAGLNLFYQSSKADTGGMICIWSNEPPYQKIKMITYHGDDKIEVANQWVMDNIDRIKLRLKDPKYILFDKDILEKMT